VAVGEKMKEMVHKFHLVVNRIATHFGTYDSNWPNE